MKKINKVEFNKMVYEKLERKYPVRDIYWIVKAVFECVEDIIRDGDKLIIKDLFSLQPKLKNERVTGNFGNKCTIPSRYVPYFKPSKRLRQICKDLKETDGFENGKQR